MQIKSFSAHSSKEVLALIKGELGPEAVILDSREEDGVITMTAAADRDSLRKHTQRRLDRPRGEGGKKTAPERDAPPAPGFEPIGANPVRYKPFSQDLPGLPGPLAAVAAKNVPLVPDDETNGEAPPKRAPLDVEEAAAEAFRVAHARTLARQQSAVVPPLEGTRAAPRRAKTGAAGQPGRSSARKATATRDDKLPHDEERSAPAPLTAPPGWQHWHEEWDSLKDQIMSLMKPALRLDDLPPKQRLAIEFLQREGVEDEAVVRLYQHLQRNPASSVLTPLARLVPVRPWNADSWPQRIQFVAGPFGAGKTSVSIRMALSLRKNAPDCRICLVNADATRGNGRLLLRHYCDLSDMTYKEASTTLELVAALDTALREGFDRILVDLPGLSRGRFLAPLLADAGLDGHTGETPDDIAVHLAMPPHYAGIQLRGLLKRYRCPHAGGIVWTKLDEAEHYGQMVNMAVASGLPVSGLSYGPGLGNSFAPAGESMLWRLLFKRELPIET